MVKANVIPGKFLSCLLGIFIGILLTLGGLVGGGFYAYKNVKVGSILGLFNQGNEWLSDEYAQNTIEGLVKELQSLANGDITLEKIAQISPAAGDKIDDVLENVNQNGIVTLDRDALYKTPINQLTSNLMDVVIITSTLDSLSDTMNFALPDMPLITGGGQDKEIWVYTAVNDNETHTIDKAIALGDYTYYTKSLQYERITEEKITPLYSLSGVIPDENGYLKKDGKFIYARTAVQGDSGEPYRYTKLERDSKLIDAADGETYTFLTDQLFFKSGPDGDYEQCPLTDGGSRKVFAVPSAYAYRLLYAEQGGEYVLATEATGWKLPFGAANTNYYYRDTNGKYVLAETQNGVYTHAVLYYLDAQEELAEIQLVPARLSIKEEFKTSVLYSKFKYAVNDGGYDFANLYYFDYDSSAFKRVETTYNAETKKYTVSAGDADKTLYTHGKAVGVWKYLLTDKDGMEMICTVNNIGSLVANVSYNVNHAKLKDLNADGLINVTSESGADIFSTPIPESISPTHTATTLGELTIGDAINVIVTVLNMIPHL